MKLSPTYPMRSRAAGIRQAVRQWCVSRSARRGDRAPGRYTVSRPALKAVLMFIAFLSLKQK